MEYIYSTIWSILDLVFFHFVWRAFLPRNTAKVIYCISLIVAWGLPLGYTIVGFDSAYEQLFSILVVAFVCMVNYGGSILQRLLYIVLAYIFGALIDSAFLYGASALLEISLADLVWKKTTYAIVVTASKLITVFLAWIVFRLRREKTYAPLHRKWLLLTVLFPTVSLIMLAIVFHSSRNQEDLSMGSVILSAILAVSNGAIIYLLQIMEKNIDQAKNTALLNQRMEIQTDSILALEQNYRRQRKATHEFHNHLQTIQGLLEVNDNSTALSYIQQIQGFIPTRERTVNSHHPIIDAVLNQKYQTAINNNIDVALQVNDLSSVTIDSNHLVVLLSNLFDNAIEACQRINGERVIECSILLRDSLFVSVRNTSLPVKIEDNLIRTTKEPKEDHGYGLMHIGLILEQLNSEYTFAYQDGWFEFAADIPQNLMSKSMK